MIKYVIKYKDRWAVKNANSARVTQIFNTQKEAITFASSLDNKTCILIEGNSGRLRRHY